MSASSSRPNNRDKSVAAGGMRGEMALMTSLLPTLLEGPCTLVMHKQAPREKCCAASRLSGRSSPKSRPLHPRRNGGTRTGRLPSGQPPWLYHFAKGAQRLSLSPKGHPHRPRLSGVGSWQPHGVGSVLVPLQTSTCFAGNPTCLTNGSHSCFS